MANCNVFSGQADTDRDGLTVVLASSFGVVILMIVGLVILLLGKDISVCIFLVKSGLICHTFHLEFLQYVSNRFRILVPGT